MRLDQFVVSCLEAYSRNQVQRWIRQGLVEVDGRPAAKAGQMLEAGATVRVEVPPPQPTALVPEPVPLQVIFENQDLLVVDKPAGMVVHPSAGHQTGTLVHAALAHAPDLEGVGGVQRPGVVHRLDKLTSGLILLAKNDRTHRFLQNQFRARQVEKFYLALVDGAPPTPEGRIEVAIARDPAHRKRMAVVPAGRGREAVSEYRTLARYRAHTLVEVRPVTGRTHQIRVHLAWLGCPVVGDRVYGRTKPSLPIQRHFLHASRLRIRIPGEPQKRTFEAPLPPDLAQVLEMLAQPGRA